MSSFLNSARVASTAAFHSVSLDTSGPRNPVGVAELLMRLAPLGPPPRGRAGLGDRAAGGRPIGRVELGIAVAVDRPDFEFLPAALPDPAQSDRNAGVAEPPQHAIEI